MTSNEPTKRLARHTTTCQPKPAVTKRVHHGNGGLAIFPTMAIIVIVTSISMLAKGETLALQSVSEKTTGMMQNKVEIRVSPWLAIGSIKQCRQTLRDISDQSEQVKRVRKTLKKNLHFRLLGDGHLILRPGWYADYSNIAAAHSEMCEDDIPVLVSLIGRGKLKDGMRSIGFGALRMFGKKALPCIEAGMAMYPDQASELFAIKGNIEVDNQHPAPSRKSSDSLHPETQK